MILHQPSSIKGQSWKKVRGKLTSMAALDKLTWFGVGGPSEWLFEPADAQDLVFLLQNCPNEIPIHIVGSAKSLDEKSGYSSSDNHWTKRKEFCEKYSKYPKSQSFYSLSYFEKYYIYKILLKFYNSF